jgi:integrase
MSDVTRPSDRDAVRIHVLATAEELAYFEAARSKPTLYDVSRLILLQECRPEEIMSLRQADVDPELGTLRIRGGKTRAAQRLLNLVSESRDILGRTQTPGKWVFPSHRYPDRPITKSNNQVCCDAGVSFCLHDLRHTFATPMAQTGVDMPTLAAILGHSGLRTVMKYVHPQQEHKLPAMKKYESTLIPIGHALSGTSAGTAVN